MLLGSEGIYFILSPLCYSANILPSSESQGLICSVPRTTFCKQGMIPSQKAGPL